MIPRIATAATNTTKPCSRCSSTLEPVSEVKRLDESRKHWHQYFYSSRLNTKYCGYTSTADAFRRGKVFLRQALYSVS